ncbi:cytochrome P450 750A1-like [Cicer arietinum]|uniref:Cytochrome P450 CYP736A12-like n=1 Tax=Cicer arietinum TaxID=3827 RepID=A0A1S3EFZ8_CICAR|nr:cytochrome P450 CYP736A12-like [Cicer arietinum]
MLPLTLAIPTILFLILILILSSHLIFHPKQHQHNKKHPPGPKPLPIIGNLHILGKLPHRTLQTLSKKHGPIMSLKLGKIPTIIVSSPEIAKQFLKTYDTVFSSRPKIQASKYMFYGGKGLGLAPYGTYWRNMKKLCTLHLLSDSKIKMFEPLRNEELRVLLKSIEKNAILGEVVNLSEMVGEVIANITYKMVLGCNKDSNLDLKGLIREAMNLAGSFNLADFLPWLDIFDLQGLTSRMKKTSKSFDQMVEKIIKDHEHSSNTIKEDPHHKDFIDILLSLMHQSMDPHDKEQKHVIDITNIKAIILDMIGGALDSSTTTIEWIMSELLRHPNVMKKLQNEIENVVGMNNKVKDIHFENLPYLNMIVKETLRLYPAGPLLAPRECLKDVTIDGYYIKKNSRVIINAWAIGRDPKVWTDNCDVFYPERFMNSNVDLRGHDFQLIPFGSGRRGCPGIQLGLNTVRLVVAQLVHCFNWELPFGISPNDLDMSEKFGLSMPRNSHLLVVPTIRRHKKPPGLEGLPILGNLHILGSLPHRTLQTLSQKYGPIMSLRLGLVPTIVVTSPELAELFLKTHESNFASRPKIEASKYLSYGNKGLVFSQYGPYWRNMRKVCTLQLLSVMKVESFAPLRKNEVERMVELVKKKERVGEVVNISEIVEGVLEEIVYKMVLGCSKDDMFDLKGLVKEIMLLAGKFNFADFVPWIGVLDLQGLRRSFKRTSKALDKMLEKIINDKEQSFNAQNGGHKDFIEILLSMMDQPIDPYDEQNHIIDRTNIKAIILDMISAAFDTSTTVILWVLSELLRNPKVIKKIQDELDKVVGVKKLVEEIDLVKLNYLDMVIKESFRLHPATPLIMRASIKDTIINGYHIEKNSRILINIWAIGRDPKIWSDNVDVFYPERFIDNNIDIKGNDFEMLPFGSGRRGCPGMNLGLVSVKFILAQLMHCFNWELPKGISIEELDMMEQYGLTAPRATHLFAVPKYRLLI